MLSDRAVPVPNSVVQGTAVERIMEAAVPNRWAAGGVTSVSMHLRRRVLVERDGGS